MKNSIKAAVFALGLVAANPPADTLGSKWPVASTLPTRLTRDGKEVAAYEEADRQSPPPKGGILFIGVLGRSGFLESARRGQSGAQTPRP